jgi:hypothetical protein
MSRITENEEHLEDRKAANDKNPACKCALKGRRENGGAKQKVRATARTAPLRGANQRNKESTEKVDFLG